MAKAMNLPTVDQVLLKNIAELVVATETVQSVIFLMPVVVTNHSMEPVRAVSSPPTAVAADLNISVARLKEVDILLQHWVIASPPEKMTRCLSMLQAQNSTERPNEK